MSSALFNVCLFRWTTYRGTWRVRLAWNRQHDEMRAWHRVWITRLYWTRFLNPYEGWKEDSR